MRNRYAEELDYQLGDVTALHGHERWDTRQLEKCSDEDIGGLLTFTSRHPADRVHRAISINGFTTHACLNAGEVGGRDEESNV